MKEWISKYQKAIVGTGALAVLVLCYFQQKELSKLKQGTLEGYHIEGISNPRIVKARYKISKKYYI